MTRPLCVLLIDDSEDDASLVLHELQQGGYAPTWGRVDTPAALTAALAQRQWDVITCDYVMPKFSPLDALQLIHEHGVDAPVIIISGQVDEEIAVSAMRAGAHDYVSKHKLTRLVPAIERELRDAEVRRARQQADAALRENQRWLNLALNASDVSLWSWDVGTNDLRLSPRWIAQLGYAEADIPNTFEEWATHIHPNDRDHLLVSVPAYLQAPSAEYEVEFRLRHKDGSYRWFLSRASLLRDSKGRPERLMGCHIDITGRKRAEERTSVLLQIAKDVSGTVDLTEILDRVQRRTARVLRCDVVMTFCWDKAQEVSRMISHYGIPADHLPAVQALSFRPATLFGGRVTQGETVVVNDLSGANEAIVALFGRFGIAALVAAPLPGPGGRLGAFIALRARAGRPFEADQVDLCTGIAGQLAVAIEAAELHRAQQEEAQISQALARIGRELIAALDAPGLLDRLCQITTEVLVYDSSHTLLWQADEDVFRPIAGYGATPEEREAARVMRIPRVLMAGLLARLESDDVTQGGTVPHDLLSKPEQERLGTGRTLCMALRRGTQLIGVQVAMSRSGRASFTEAQRRIARGIAQVASLALEHARVVTELDQANRLKSEFVATMSHELRTPINVITGYTDLLLEGAFGDLTRAQAEAAERVQYSARQLYELITATLDLSRLDAGRMPEKIEDVQLAEVIEQLRAESREWQERAGLQLVWDVGPDVPHLRTDRAMVKLVLKNLIGNAVKFTEQGTVTVAVHPCADGVEMAVSDTGVGIAPEALPIIFQPFRQADNSDTRRYGGVGLGLYIVQRLLDTLGGSIAVESAVGQGSTFRVCLPLSRTGK